MRDDAADTSDINVASPEARNSVGQPHPLVPSPALVPAMGPSARDDFVAKLQQIVGGPKANSRYETKRARKPSNEPEDGQEQPQEDPSQDRPQDQPQVEPQVQSDEPVADAAIDERAQDALKLLQELAHKSGRDEQAPQTPAGEPDPTLASYLAVVAEAGEVRTARPNTESPPPLRASARFALAGCFAVLAAGTTGLFLWSQIVPAPDRRSAATHVTAAAPSEPSSVAARTRLQPHRTAMAECDMAAAKNPYAEYFLVGANALGGQARPARQPSGGDHGWYSLMAMKAMLERRGGLC